jgi:ABC-type sugar transport system ATPase subunit
MDSRASKPIPEIAAPAAVSGAAPRTEPIFSVETVSKSFGPVQALKSISLDFHPGEIRAICGENGAGKSTLVKILGGIERPDSGAIRLDGRLCALTSPLEAQRLGIAMVAQELSICPDLTVLDNIWLGSVEVPFFHRTRDIRQQARDALVLLGAEHIDLDVPARLLPMGERQLVEIARMLTRKARVFILDEPTATLSDREIDRIFVALKRIKREGHLVIYITHRLGEVFKICDSITVLRNGQLIGTSKVAEIDRKRLIEQMLGRPFVDMYPEHGYVPGEAALEIEHLNVPGEVEDFNTVVPRGDIVFVAGQVGSGAEAVVRTVAGLVYDAIGTIRVNGRAMPLGSAEAAFKHNVYFVSGDRAEEGVFCSLDVMTNLIATRFGQFSRFGFLNLGALRRQALQLAGRIGIDPRRLRSRADELSGGNQQKLAFGRCIGQSANGVIVLIEPTRGIDIGARAEIYQLMREFCFQGYGLLVASTDLEEVIGVGDVVYTMYRSRVINQYRGKDINMQQIVADITHPVH